MVDAVVRTRIVSVARPPLAGAYSVMVAAGNAVFLITLVVSVVRRRRSSASKSEPQSWRTTAIGSAVARVLGRAITLARERGHRQKFPSRGRGAAAAFASASGSHGRTTS